MLKMFRGRDRRSQGGVSHNDVQIFKHLEEADVDTLIDELAVLTDNAADGNVDLDKINAYLDALDEKDPIPFGVSAEDSLAKFHARHDLLTKELSKSHQKRSKSKRIATKGVRLKESARAGQQTAEKDSNVQRVYVVRGIQHYIVDDGAQTKIVWANGNFECRICGDISEEEAIAIIDSIYKEG